MKEMTQITTIDSGNFAAMAKAMGIANEGTTSKSSTLPRLRINHKPIMGLAEVNGKKVNMEVVEGGTYRLDVAEDKVFYATEIKLRPFMQRFMLKRFVKGVDKAPNRFIKTLMSDDLTIDLKDNDGGFNCGKTAGYIEDFKALPEKMQNLIKQIKRVRAVFGTVELVNPTNQKGEPVELESTPFIWEIDNRDAFKEFGTVFAKFNKNKRLPPQHIVDVATSEQPLPNGDSFYLPVATVDMSDSVPLTPEDDDTIAQFVDWIDNYNTYIINTWAEKARPPEMESEDVSIIDDIVDVEIDEEVA